MGPEGPTVLGRVCVCVVGGDDLRHRLLELTEELLRNDRVRLPLDDFHHFGDVSNLGIGMGVEELQRPCRSGILGHDATILLTRKCDVLLHVNPLYWQNCLNRKSSSSELLPRTSKVPDFLLLQPSWLCQATLLHMAFAGYLTGYGAV
jgi:hypothetical protein